MSKTGKEGWFSRFFGRAQRPIVIEFEKKLITEVQPGSVVLIAFPGVLRGKVREEVGKKLSALSKSQGIQFLFLEGGTSAVIKL